MSDKHVQEYTLHFDHLDKQVRVQAYSDGGVTVTTQVTRGVFCTTCVTHYDRGHLTGLSVACRKWDEPPEQVFGRLNARVIRSGTQKGFHVQGIEWEPSRLPDRLHTPWLAVYHGVLQQNAARLRAADNTTHLRDSAEFCESVDLILHEAPMLCQVNIPTNIRTL